MKLNDISFPYPVLGNNDDITPRPKLISSDVLEGRTMYTFTFDFEVVNEDIQTLIAENKATFFCEVDCKSTLYRRAFYSETPKFKIEIPRKSVGRILQFTCTVVATEYIKGYTNSCAHEDYAGFSFDIEPGEILAILGQFDYSVDINYDKLKAIDSIIQILPSDTSEITWYDLNNDKITIQLPRTLYNKYRSSISRNRAWTPILHASLLLNAVSYALSNYTGHETYKWARALRYRMMSEPKFADYKIGDLNAHDIVIVAQLILGDPFAKLLGGSFNSEVE